MQQFNWKKDSEFGGSPCQKQDEISVASLYILIKEDGVRKKINMTIPGDMKALGGEFIPENWHLGGKPTDGSSHLIFLLHLWPVILNI